MYAIGTVTKGTGDDAHYRLLAELKTLAEAVGWTTLRYDTASAERELILHSTGTSGDESIFVGFNGADSTFASAGTPGRKKDVRLAVFTQAGNAILVTSYTKLNTGVVQPGQQDALIGLAKTLSERWTS